MKQSDIAYSWRLINGLRESNFLSRIYIDLARAAIDKCEPDLCKRLLARQREIDKQGDLINHELEAIYGQKVKE